MFCNEHVDVMTSKNRNENNKCQKRKIKARPPRLRLTASRVASCREEGEHSLAKSAANNILTERSDKGGASLQQPRAAVQIVKNDAEAWEQTCARENSRPQRGSLLPGPRG